MTENWLPIPGYPGYEVSDMGRVRSYRKRFCTDLESTPHLLRSPLDNNGYPAVNLGGGQYRRVHTLVMLAFVGPPPEGLEVCHGPNGPNDSRLSNLRYDTHQGNMRDVAHYKGVEEGKRQTRKFKDSRALQIRTEYATGQATMEELSKKHSLTIGAVSRIINGIFRSKAGGPIRGIDYEINRKTA